MGKVKIPLSTKVFLLVLGLFVVSCAVPTPMAATKTPVVTPGATVMLTTNSFDELTAIAEETQRADQSPTVYMPTPGTLTLISTPAVSNVVKYFDFEDKPQQFTSLGVCDLSSPEADWWNFCHDAPAKLIQSDNGFTGQYSLGIRAELLPEREQVYSVRFLINPPQVVDALSAVVYIADTTQASFINFAALHVDGTEWIISRLPAERIGWSQIYLEMQPYSSDDTISEVHIDWFLRKADRQSVEILLMIDDLRFYYPASMPLESNP